MRVGRGWRSARDVRGRKVPLKGLQQPQVVFTEALWILHVSGFCRGFFAKSRPCTPKKLWVRILFEFSECRGMYRGKSQARFFVSTAPVEPFGVLDEVSLRTIWNKGNKRKFCFGACFLIWNVRFKPFQKRATKNARNEFLSLPLGKQVKKLCYDFFAKRVTKHASNEVRLCRAHISNIFLGRARLGEKSFCNARNMERALGLGALQKYFFEILGGVKGDLLKRRSPFVHAFRTPSRGER